MTLAEKYGIQSNTKVEEIDLNKNPYKFEGTFKEIYNLMAEGKLKLLKQDGYVVGGSVSGYDTAEEDNLAGEAFNEAYWNKPVMAYVNLATQLVEANLIPEIISEDPLRVTILNGLVTLDINGEEVNDVDATDGCETKANTFTIDGVEYCITNNPITSERDGRFHPMIARVDGKEIPNRKEIARQYLEQWGYTEEDFCGCNTAMLEKEVARILGEAE